MYWAVHLPKISKLCPCKWEYDWIHDTLICRMNEHWTFTVCLLCHIETVFSRIPILWCHEKAVQYRTSHAASPHTFITIVWWYNILNQTLFSRQATFIKFQRYTYIMLNKIKYFYNYTYLKYKAKSVDKIACSNILMTFLYSSDDKDWKMLFPWERKIQFTFMLILNFCI